MPRLLYLPIISIVLIIITTDSARSSDCSHFDWSKNPGAYEQHLARRCDNPYFPPSERLVSKQELLEAREIDNNDYILAEERLRQLAEKATTFRAGAPSPDFKEFREDVEALIMFSLGVGGRASEIARMASQLRDAWVADVQAAFSNNEELSKILRENEAFYHRNMILFSNPLFSQVVRERSPISQTDVASAVLSEDPNTIRLFMTIMGETTKAEFRRQALIFLKEARQHGYVDPKYSEKVAALEEREG